MHYFIKDVKDHIGETRCPAERKVKNFLVDQQLKIIIIKYFSIMFYRTGREHIALGIRHDKDK